jgi:hypothetical protein
MLVSLFSDKVIFMMHKVGHWAFIAGVGLALFGGILQSYLPYDMRWGTWVLIVLGLAVGIMNITARETQEFLVASVALVIAASSATAAVNLHLVVIQMLGNVVAFVFPAALVVALKAIWGLAQD